MLKVQKFTFNPFAENTFVLSDETGACVVIDPGCMNRHEQAELGNYLAENQLRLEKVLNTHCHIDHIFGNSWLVNKFKVPLVANRKDLLNLRGSVPWAQMNGLPFDPSPEPDVNVEEGDKVTFGTTTLEVIFTPGHAPGHVSFFHPSSKKLFSGDVLFDGSIGRTDLPGGNYETLMESIVNKLLPMADEVLVHCGHGPETTIGKERRRNPFILEYLQHRVPGR